MGVEVLLQLNLCSFGFGFVLQCTDPLNFGGIGGLHPLQFLKQRLVRLLLIGGFVKEGLIETIFFVIVGRLSSRLRPVSRSVVWTLAPLKRKSFRTSLSR